MTLWEVLGGRRGLLAGYLLLVGLIAVPQYVLVTGNGFTVPYLREYLVKNYYPDHRP